VAQENNQVDIGSEQGKLRDDVQVVRQYAELHPESWVELRFENEPSVRIVAVFSGDELDAHESKLRRLVAYPDQLEVRHSPWPRTRHPLNLEYLANGGSGGERLMSNFVPTRRISQRNCMIDTERQSIS
jgi:hypothetical protein